MLGCSQQGMLSIYRSFFLHESNINECPANITILVKLEMLMSLNSMERFLETCLSFVETTFHVTKAISYSIIFSLTDDEIFMTC